MNLRVLSIWHVEFEYKFDMKFQKSYVVKFVTVSLALVSMIVFALSLMASENPLVRAARNSDTIVIDAKYDSAKKELSVIQTVQYKNQSNDSLANIKFHIYANAYRNGAKFPPVTAGEVAQAFPNGQDFGGIYIDEVRAGKVLVPIMIEGDDQNVLSVPLTAKLRPNKSIEIFGYKRKRKYLCA